jgi:hypothetical protein
METEEKYEALRYRQRRRRKCTTFWVRNWLSPERRLAVGHYHQLMEELRLDDHGSFYSFLRITPALFDELHERITPFITKGDTNYRRAIELGIKLAITLRYISNK